jgi:quaternary ammonium compound-resistance protein SugE
VSWFYLVLAGLLEIGWPLGLKVAENPDRRVQGILTAVLFMAGSGTCLWFAQRRIPMGTAYAVWTGIGAVGTLITGIMLYGESANVVRLGSASLIVLGIVGLKMAHG